PDVDDLDLDADVGALRIDGAGQHLPDPEPARGLVFAEPLARHQEIQELTRVDLHALEETQLRIEAVAHRCTQAGVYRVVRHALEGHDAERDFGRRRN